MKPFALVADGLTLDRPLETDVETITAYCQDPTFERYLTTPWPYRREHAVGFVESLVPEWWRSESELTWAIRHAPGAPLLGVVGLGVGANRARGIGFWLGAPHRGQGIMPRAVEAVCGWALDAGGAASVHWECVVGNVASMAVARKTGFAFTGVGPGRVPSRTGEAIECWHGELRAGASREPKLGWPA
ncbi:GNAT family N-acetyltransferase [Galbitalea sp. SE-J8]|uniref:GNAT family N-acetyltransferase n=1 Tax=Galbitalea sp. SE-J8 TaxID=3054952 RepID=UPI00259CF2DC|nr:GNAT family N-acetyltransferase [Galbitalea sp. SE-J8]MDM4763635.1 GNAT family N-acetyltransferase [Galbitalea sp. SE-J8]